MQSARNMTAAPRTAWLALALVLLPTAAAGEAEYSAEYSEISDLSIYFADPAAGDIGAPPEDDTCTYSTVFGTMDAQAGCGIPIVVDGVPVNRSSYDGLITFIAGGRNAIHIKTRTQVKAPEGSLPPLYNVTVGLQVSSYSDDRVRLCDQMTVLREGYDEGTTFVPMTNLGDPTTTDILLNDATISARSRC